MKVLITGAQGQLGIDIQSILKEDFEVYGFSRKELDVTDLTQMRHMANKIKPDAIIHSAAYTKVDQAESDSYTAFQVNAEGTKNAAIAAKQAGAKIVFISSDYVFDGTQRVPYKESDSTNPLSVYGKSKLAGEEMVQSHINQFFIVRTSWVYGLNGNNFVKTMLRLAQERDEVSVVHDQIGSPTYTRDLAHFIKELILTEKYGIYHASNSGSCSWYEFASAIFEEAKVKIKVTPIETKDYPLPAPRPAYSVLDHEAIRTKGFTDLPHWREALKKFIRSYFTLDS